jgi:cellulose biosynthesis protein BcsQ
MGLDYIIFDTAPSVGGIQERAIWASDKVLVPTATEFLAADGVRKIYEAMAKLKKEQAWTGYPPRPVSRLSPYSLLFISSFSKIGSHLVSKSKAGLRTSF